MTNYIIIKGDKVYGEQKSIKKAKKLCNQIEKSHNNCTLAKEIKR